MNTRRYWTPALIALLVVVVLLQTYRGLTFTDPAWPAERSEQLRHHDYRWIYVSGKAWLQGISPHVPEKFAALWLQLLGEPDMVFPSPPTLVVVSAPVGLLDWEASHYLFDAINVSAFVLTIGFLIAIGRRYAPAAPARLWGAAAVCALGGAFAGVIYAGQTSILVALGIVATTYFVLSDRLWYAALFMVLASIKPQMSLLPFIALCIWRPGLFLRSVVTVGAVSLASLAMAWDPHVLDGVSRSLKLYRQIPFNRLENSTPVYRLGPGAMSWISPLLAIGLTAALALRARARAPSPVVWGIPVLLMGLLLPVHPYDFVVMTLPLFLLMAFAWSWWLLPVLVVLLRPNVVTSVLDMLHVAQAEVVMVYVRWIAILAAMALSMIAARRETLQNDMRTPGLARPA